MSRVQGSTGNYKFYMLGLREDMSKLKDMLFEDHEDMSEEAVDIELGEEAYPKKIHVDGYDVNHYHDGDTPVYEILDNKGNIIDVAHSTNEMHEITGRRAEDKE